MNPQSKKKVVIGMSGGVDSSMAAALLLDEGYEVIGVTMQMWKSSSSCGSELDTPGDCCSISAIDDARRVAHQLGIPHYVLNFRASFEEKVVQYFVASYLRGETPNPCMACNRYLKFGELLQKAQGLGAEYVATGHYAKIRQAPDSRRFVLEQGADTSKDQSYALYMLTQDQLAHTLFPLGQYRKEDIRKMARERGLNVVADKPDSQEICFVPDDNYAGFIEKRALGQIHPGYFVDREGKVLGRHQGLIYYTIGQRKGLGITFGKPMFVIGFNPAHNEVILGESAEVYARELWAKDLNWMMISNLTEPLKVKVKIRYKANAAEAVIYPEADVMDDFGETKKRVRVVFTEAQRAITPGQAVVFYNEARIVGGGTIVSDPMGHIF